jgi:hypothetical protein
MSKEEKSRFEDLFSAARSRQQKPGSKETQPPRRSKSSDPNYVRTTVYLPKELHRQLKAAAASEDREMSEVVDQLIEAWLKSREG